jgi:hypothetical protein
MSAAPMPKPTHAALHTCEHFAFTADAPLDIAWPLFGADKERAWAPGWHPKFVWPANAMDQEGMVFKVAQGGKTAVWVNTAFDRPARHIQYVCVLPEVMVTVVTLRLASLDHSTRIAVTYARTALDKAANDAVKAMAERDRAAGREWEEQINTYLRRGR